MDSFERPSSAVQPIPMDDASDLLRVLRDDDQRLDYEMDLFFGGTSGTVDAGSDPTTKGVGKGTGQGLSIAYRIVVNRHNGQIGVKSAEGKGTTFIITLPVSTA